MELPEGGINMSSGLGGRRDIDGIFTENLQALLVLFMEYGLRDAAAYTEQAGRRGVQKEDMVRSLKSLAVGGFWKNNVEADLARTLQEMYEDEDEDEEKEESEEENEEEGAPEEWTEASGSELSDRLNAAVDIFETWVPQTPMERILKGAVEQAEE